MKLLSILNVAYVSKTLKILFAGHLRFEISRKNISKLQIPEKSLVVHFDHSSSKAWLVGII